MIKKMVGDSGEQEIELTRIHSDECKYQRIFSPGIGQRMEGVAISPTGIILGTALSDGNRIYLYKRAPGSSRFESVPCSILGGSGTKVNYPHDLSFSLEDDGQLLAVAQRSASILIFSKHAGKDTWLSEPVFEISGPDSLLDNSDGVAFLPPSGNFLAACNLTPHRITFYKRHGQGEATRFDVTPCFIMEGNGIYEPDGLAFSSDGKWLAVANHGGNSVVVFRRSETDDDGILAFDPEPVVVIDDDSLKYSHSVTFTPDRAHLVVTNAGANYVNVYPRITNNSGTSWSTTPRQQLLIGSDHTFREVNVLNKMEGGPKGVACENGLLAVCRPETGVTVYPCEETDAGLLLVPCIEFSLDLVPVRSKQVQLEEYELGFVVSRLDGGSTFRINAPTALVLSMCDGEQTIGQIATDLKDLYPENCDVGGDVEYAVAQLYNADAISINTN